MHIEELAKAGSVQVTHSFSRSTHPATPPTYDISVKNWAGELLIGVVQHESDMKAFVGEVLASELHGRAVGGDYVSNLNTLEIMSIRGTLVDRIESNDWSAQSKFYGGCPKGPFDLLQQVVLESYADGFHAVQTPADVAGCGDGLLKFLLAELSVREDCADAEDAVKRLDSAIGLLDGLKGAFESLALAQAPVKAVDTHQAGEGVRVLTQSHDSNDCNDALPAWCVIDLPEHAIRMLARAAQAVQASAQTDLKVDSMLVDVKTLGAGVAWLDKLGLDVAGSGDVQQYETDLEGEDLPANSEYGKATMSGQKVRVYADAFAVMAYDQSSGDDVESSTVHFRNVAGLEHILPRRPAARATADMSM